MEVVMGYMPRGCVYSLYSLHYSPLLHPPPLNVFQPPRFSFQSHVVVCVYVCAHVCVCVPTLDVVPQVLPHWPDVHHIGYTGLSLRSKDLPISAPWQWGVTALVFLPPSHPLWLSSFF